MPTSGGATRRRAGELPTGLPFRVLPGLSVSRGHRASNRTREHRVVHHSRSLCALWRASFRTGASTNCWHEQLLPPPKAKPRKRTPPPTTRSGHRGGQKRPLPMIRSGGVRVREEVKATGPNTPPAELARRLHMDVREVRRHLRTLGYNAKPPE